MLKTDFEEVERFWHVGNEEIAHLWKEEDGWYYEHRQKGYFNDEEILTTGHTDYVTCLKRLRYSMSNHLNVVEITEQENAENARRGMKIIDDLIKRKIHAFDKG